MTAESRPREPRADPVGATEVAARLGVRRSVVDNWHSRGRMPAARWRVGGRAAWDWTADIEPWARERGHLK